MSEDLLARNTEESSVDVSQAWVIGIGVASAAAAFLMGYGIHGIIADGGLSGGNVAMNALGAILFPIIFLFQVLLIKSSKIQMMLAGAATVALALSFLMSWSWLFLFAVALAYVFFVRAVRKGKREMENEMKIQFFVIARQTIPSVITGLSLFASILYIALGTPGSPFISRGTFLTLVRPAEPLMHAMGVKNFSWDMTAAQFAESAAKLQFGSAFTALPSATQSEAIAQIMSQLRAQAAHYGIVFKNTDTVGGILYAYLAGQYRAIPTAYKSWIPLVIFVLTLLTAKGLGSIVGWIVVPIAYVVYELLRAAGLIRIQLEPRSREVIVVG